jgi:hypothetical protein
MNRYTASCGERRIRVHTAAAPVVADLGEMYRQADAGAIVSLFSRLGTVKLDPYAGDVICYCRSPHPPYVFL